MKPTTAPGQARSLACQAVQEGFHTIVAAGGDGTINEVLNGIGDAPDGFTRARLAVLPTGTINVFAKELGIPQKLEAAWQVVQRDHETTIDVARAEFTENGQSHKRYFVQLAGAGLDSRANALVDPEQKKKWGALAYILAGFRALAESKPTIKVSSGHTETQGELVLIGNGRYYGGRLNFFPGAQLTDGRLDYLVFPKTTWVTLLQVGGGYLANRLHLSGNAVSFQAAQCTLTSSAKVALQLDGENVGFLPATIIVHPKTLRLLVP
jgi:YegS/Rv2252/BmrU family lipid kinase